jgi:hypothetical protein
MGEEEYLLSYGNAGDFGRFRGTEPLACQRGDRVVARTPRGQEIGFIMRPASPGHGRLLANQSIGQILRRATEGDFELAQRLRQRSQRLFEDGCRFVHELSLPMEILDAEILLDARQAILHYLRWTDCDPRPLLDALSQRYHLLVTLHDLALPSGEGAEEQQDPVGCGVDGCGGGGCGSCASKNCSTCVAHRNHRAANESNLHVGSPDEPLPHALVPASPAMEPPRRVSLV